MSVAVLSPFDNARAAYPRSVKIDETEPGEDGDDGQEVEGAGAKAGGRRVRVVGLIDAGLREIIFLLHYAGLRMVKVVVADDVVCGWGARLRCQL